MTLSRHRARLAHHSGHRQRSSWLDATPTVALVIAVLGWGARLVADTKAARLAAADSARHILPPSSADFTLGQGLPELTLLDQDRHGVRLGALSGRPSWLVFFRGADCPFCREQLRQLGQLSARVEASGVRLVAASPDPPETSARLRSELGLRFPLLSDPGEQAVTALCAGRGHCQVLVDAGGTVRWAGFSETWSDGPKPEALLEMARQL